MNSTVYTCTSNGTLRRTKLPQVESEQSPSLSSLPMRLCEWRLSEDARTFAYGGEEVELSLWDAEKAFSERPPVAAPASADPKKRKRGDQLLPGELWRAKNVSFEQCCFARRSPTRTAGLQRSIGPPAVRAQYRPYIFATVLQSLSPTSTGWYRQRKREAVRYPRCT